MHQLHLCKQVFDFGRRPVSHGYFGKYHVIDDERPAATGLIELGDRPGYPFGIAGYDIKQDIGINEGQSSPRVSAMTSSVVIPGPA